MTELAPLPEVTADELTTLTQFLDYFRSVLLRKVDGLSDEQARVKIPPSGMDLLGLIRHLALVEQFWFTQAFAGVDEQDLWSDPDDEDRDFHHTAEDTLEVAVRALESEIVRSRLVVAGAASLDQLTAIDVGPVSVPERRGPRSLRWVLVHMVEEYARHCGHADLFREVADGSVGD